MEKYRWLDVEKTVVLNRDTGANIPVDGGGWQGDEFRAWLADGHEPDSLPPPTFADYVAQFTPGLQAWMEEVARSNAYDSVLSCISYIDDEVQQFAGDARAMKAWRSALWKWAAAWQAGFNGQLPAEIPTLQEVIAMAPQPEAFGWVVHAPGQIIESQLPPVATA